MSTSNETEAVLLEKLSHHVATECEGHTTIILTPTSNILSFTQQISLNQPCRNNRYPYR